MDDKVVTGAITGINGNMVTVRVSGKVHQNELAYVITGDERLKAEIIKLEGGIASLQVYESTRGLKAGDRVDFTGEMLFVKLGPGILGQVYDGLQNPLHKLAKEHGFFLRRGVFSDPLDLAREWFFRPTAQVGTTVTRGSVLGHVQENSVQHLIMVPFHLSGTYTLTALVEEDEYRIIDTIAVLTDEDGHAIDLTMVFEWPVKIPITAYRRKLTPEEPLVTQCRVIDTLCPVSKGGSFCIPGPFGAGKTVLQQTTSRHAQVDIVIIAACGERAGEIVETIHEFAEIEDPRTGRKLMERTVVIANTSSMPVAAREASVYTAVTLGEYYRQMGLDVLLLADSTSRWAQAMRELSGRLEEIPGEEAFPAYLESRIADFYERSGYVDLGDARFGSLTIGGTVSPAGGNFEEPVTQATLKVVDAFHGLSRARSDARRFPAIDPLESWSHGEGIIDSDRVERARGILRQGDTTSQMMMVVGEDGTAMGDFVTYLKADLFDSVYLQQDAYHDVDTATSAERQRYVFDKIFAILEQELTFKDKAEARHFFARLNQMFIDWNRIEMGTTEFKEQEAAIDAHCRA